ncbi:MAG TPA: hypothetical protein VKU87_04935 [Thermomicrobiaceae bacterium]|nr:hypothetical protein [Thermomicrobiaceae bacterium]
MPSVAATRIAFSHLFRRLFLPGLLALLVVILMIGGDASAAGSAARSGLILAGSCQLAPGPPVPASASEIQRDAFVRRLADAKRLSSLPVAVPPILPRGTVVQGFDVPSETGGLHVVVVDITQNCGLYAPRVMQIHESNINPSLPPAISAEFKRLTIGGKHVGMLSGNNAAIYAWDDQAFSYWLTVDSTSVVSQSQVEQIIAALP